MTNHLIHRNESRVYPGEYIPSPEIKKSLVKLKFNKRPIPGSPLVNMEETDHDYRIEVGVPDIKNEQILMYANRHSLSIAIIPNHLEKSGRKLKLHEFDASRLKRYINLPVDADTMFVSAEHREGILLLHIPKTNKPVKTKRTQIVVY